MRKLILCVVACAVGLVRAGYGPRNNPDDQIRAFWLVHEKRIYTNVVDLGVNTVICQQWGCKPHLGFCYPQMVTNRTWWLERTTADGIDYIEQLYAQQETYFNEKYPRKNRDGSADKRRIDASDPAALKEMLHCVDLVFATIPDDPPASFVGVQPSSEVRDGTHPSYTPAFRDAWTKASGGKEIPPNCDHKTAPVYRTIPGFPVSRIVPDGDPYLEFYRWFWKEGDGWNAYENAVVGKVKAKFARPMMTMYDPAVRTPPVWGSGGDVSHLNHWLYVYPEPFNISYVASEEMTMARGANPVKEVMMMIQGISYRSALAPKERKVANEPVWVADRPNVLYMTTPPDLMREALWALFSRRLDGILLYAAEALFDHAPFGKPKDKAGYQFTNPETAPAARDLLHRVGIPLGPLFRAIPERPAQVAVLESFASTILADRGNWGWGGPVIDCGIMATAANLMPGVLYEEELAKGGIPASVRVLLIPQCEVLPASAVRAIVAFQKRGGIVVGDDLTAPGVLADLDLPKFRRTDDAARERREIRAATAELKAKLAPYVRPLADTDTPDILASVRSTRGADYVFAINDNRVAGDYVGQWNRVLEKGLPTCGTVTLARTAGAVYDLVEHKTVAFSVADGKTRIPVSLAAADGKALLVADRALGKLTATLLEETLNVVSPDADVLIPIGVFAEGAKPYYAVVRNGRFSRPLSGRSVRVVNLADGSRLQIGRTSAKGL